MSVAAPLETITVNSKSPFDPQELATDRGKKVKNVKIKIWSNGVNDKLFVVIGPSSTPNMEDEERLANLLSDEGYGVAVIYGYHSRKQGKKFSVTSSALAADYIAAVAALSERGYGMRYAVIGTSNGSVAAFSTGFRGVRDKLQGARLIVAGIALNAACYEDFNGKIFDPTMRWLLVSGEKDDSTPAEPCRKMAMNLSSGGVKVLHYVHPDGHHNFWVRKGRIKEGWGAENKYIIPNCAVGLTDDLGQTMRVRKSGKLYNVNNKNRSKMLKDCIGVGHRMAVSPDGESSLLQEIRSFLE